MSRTPWLCSGLPCSWPQRSYPSRHGRLSSRFFHSARHCAVPDPGYPLLPQSPGDCRCRDVQPVTVAVAGHLDRSDDVESIAEHLISEQPQIEEAIDRKRRIGLLHSAIFRLGCDIRGPVYLFYVEGYSIRTISRLYGKTPSAFKMVLHRGRRQVERMCRHEAA